MQGIGSCLLIDFKMFLVNTSDHIVEDTRVQDVSFLYSVPEVMRLRHSSF